MLETELKFYENYPWCLNAYPTVRETVQNLSVEIERLFCVSDWQIGEVAVNIYLLSCGLLNAIEEYLRGPSLRIPVGVVTRLGRWTPFAFGAIRAAEALQQVMSIRSWRRRKVVRCSHERLATGLHNFLPLLVKEQVLSLEPAAELAEILLSLHIPADLETKRIGLASVFRRQDTTHFDLLALGRRFVDRFPDRCQPLLILGLRTSGSYIAPLLKAFLKAEGYGVVLSLTIHPGKGASRWERRQLRYCARHEFMAVIVDDAPQTARSIVLAGEFARRAGFSAEKLKILVPNHSASRDCLKALPEQMVVSLEPERWHKYCLLDDLKVIEKRLTEYFPDVLGLRLVNSKACDEFNAHLQALSAGNRSARLKRVYEVELDTKKLLPAGAASTSCDIKYVLAKSVGWGWLGYHAFLAGRRLRDFVPPILGLRDGILYMEWYPQQGTQCCERQQLIETAAAYVAARTCSMALNTSMASGKRINSHEDGFRLLCKTFASNPLRGRRRQLERYLVRHRSTVTIPTLIDGRMAEWIAGPHGPLKIDYEHHGMGKSELNSTDPAYDLAETIMTLELAVEEEREFIRRYVEMTGDASSEQRLFTNKMLASMWTISGAFQQLFYVTQSDEKRQQLHRKFLTAWHFAIEQSAIYCGSFCRPGAQWRSPLVALDIDGVLDRPRFGFPSTTIEGIDAISLLHAHGFCITPNTARSVAEVMTYCRAYGFAGGVAEYGSYMWDAVNQRGQALISKEATDQLGELRAHLGRIPGVFIDDRYQHSIRAFAYQEGPRGLRVALMNALNGFGINSGMPVPLSLVIVDDLITRLGLDKLNVRQTTIDTTITASETDKGRGLLALRDWVFGSDIEIIAVGNSDADLPMFRTANRCYAPAQINCFSHAELLGCHIARKSYQKGFLEIARLITHAGAGYMQCHYCSGDVGNEFSTFLLT